MFALELESGEFLASRELVEGLSAPEQVSCAPEQVSCTPEQVSCAINTLTTDCLSQC